MVQHVLYGESSSPWVQALNGCRLLQGQASSWSGCSGARLALSARPLKQRLFLCWWTMQSTTSRLALTQPTRATQTLVLSSQLCLVLLLIAESWLEWGEERLEVWNEGVYWTMCWREEDRDEAGSGRWSLFRDWTAAKFPAASAPHRAYCGGIAVVHFPLLISSIYHPLSFLFFLAISLSIVLFIHNLSWSSSLSCLLLCFISLVSISITLPPVCGAKGSRVHVTEINAISNSRHRYQHEAHLRHHAN